MRELTAPQADDLYEIITERHRKASTVVTSNRDASEWLPLMTDPLLVPRRAGWACPRHAGWA